jgi:hypothetical protein
VTDIVDLNTDTNLFGQEISNKPQINREMFAAGLYTILRDISLEDFARLFINEVEAATEYVSLCVGERAGQRISLLFTPHRLDTAAKASPVSLYRRLAEPSFCSGLARVMILKKDRVKNLLYQSVELGVNGATFINEFPPYSSADSELHALLLARRCHAARSPRRSQSMGLRAGQDRDRVAEEDDPRQSLVWYGPNRSR